MLGVMNQTLPVCVPIKLPSELVVKRLHVPCAPCQLPLELVHRILEYEGSIKYRNGKYMNQISQDDNRYKMLQNMAKIIQNQCYWWNIKIVTRKNVIYIEKHMIWYSTYVDKDVVWCTGKGNEVIFSTEDDSRCYYSFMNHGFCYKWKICKLI